MKIYTDTPEGVTVVKNAFIDQYMPQANGEFVKVYLFLLRCANTGRELTLSGIADVLEHTEKDVRRALTYWEKQDLIHLKMNGRGEIQSITFSDLPDGPEPSRDSEQAHSGEAADEAASDSSFFVSRERIEALCEQKEIRQLFFVAEQYLQRPLTSSEQTELLYYYDTLHFSSDLIEYLLEYCISKGAFSRHYMRRVALSWAEAGISTVLQAKQESRLYNKNYYVVMNTFGIKGRSPAQPETDMMSRWFNDYAFPIDLVVEACNRTIRQIHQPSFAYADKILRQWKEKKVTSLADVRQLDQQRTDEQQKRSEQKKNTPAPQRSSNNRFNNFSQREYDYSQLEKKLLNN